jgi:LEA14-like dessication related protein
LADGRLAASPEGSIMSYIDSQVNRKNSQLERVPQQRWPGLVVTTLLLVNVLSCTSMGSIEPLDVTLANLKVTEVTVFETTLMAQLRITNPNPEAFTIDGASFKLYLEDKKVGTGTSKESFTVDRLDSSVVDVIFHINNASALLRIRDILESDDVSYGVRGGLYTQGTFGTKKLKVEKTGRIDLKNMGSLETDRPGINDAPPSG